MSNTTIHAWQVLGAVAPTALTQARLTAHWAAQVLSAAADAAIEHKPDDSHSNVEWLAEHNALTGHLIGDKMRIGLRLADLTLLVLSAKSTDDKAVAVTAELALDGATLDRANAWVASQIETHVGSLLAKPIKLRDYEMPDHPARQGEPFAIGPMVPALEELGRWFANADRVLRSLRQQNSNASPVACWPHHFDIATLIVLDPGEDAEKARSIGVGLSPGDSTYDEPYLYVNHWPIVAESERPALKVGQWAPFGAVLLGSQLVDTSAAEAEAQKERALAFIRSSVDLSRSLLAD
ncbi:MAG: hypothetical protein MJE77_35610 [Proteobacteria bacterium]|nr:hypothetical protein [Pseudomonadota bacterium]